MQYGQNDEEKLKCIVEATKKTGFLFEQEVADELRDSGWQVITNRYYVDDVSNAPREIDILAYKATISHDITNYSTIVISCKRSRKHDWVLLTRPISLPDPNLDLYPLTTWTNSEICQSMDLKRKLVDEIKSTALIDSAYCSGLFSYHHTAYAFQEVDTEKAEARNDKAIYQSIQTLLKAVHYEMKTLAAKKKQPAFYSFHLLSVVDGNIYEVRRDNSEPVATKVEICEYVNRFIVGNSDAPFRIHFVTRNGLETVLSGLNEHASYQAEMFKACIDEFRLSLLASHKYMETFRSQLKEELLAEINSVIRLEENERGHQESDLAVGSDSKNQKLLIRLHGVSDRTVQVLNSNQQLVEKTEAVVRKYYKYDGPIEYVRW